MLIEAPKPAEAAYDGRLWKKEEDGRIHVAMFAPNVAASSEGKAPFNIISVLRSRPGHRDDPVLRQAHAHMIDPKNHEAPEDHRLTVTPTDEAPEFCDGEPFVLFR